MPHLSLNDDAVEAPELRDYLDLGSKTPKWMVEKLEELGLHEEAQQIRDMVETLAFLIQSQVIAINVKVVDIVKGSGYN